MRAVTGVLSLLVLMAGLAAAQQNPRVFVTDSQSWEIGAGGASDHGTGGISGGGGARPQTAEVVKTFNERCSNVIINNRRDKADYVVVLDHEGGKGPISRDNKIAVFHNATGDAIFSRSTRSLGNSVKDACSAIYHDFSRRAAAERSNKEVEASVSPAAEAGGAAQPQSIAGSQAGANVKISASVIGADVEIDGKFVGSTPSVVHLPPGDHTVVVRKDGYAAWQRALTITGGDVNLVAELRKN